MSDRLDRLDGARVLIYSHDTFGLGHLRRCRSIAHALVERYKELTVLILSGSPIIGSFDFRARVDFVRIPGVIKLHNGDYTSLGLHIDLEQTLAIRASIIQHTAEVFNPDLFLVDKEPLGLRGEVADTLKMLSQRGTVNVLGVRDILDEPTAVAEEWERKNVIPTVATDYDQIWVYGLEEIADPLEGVRISPEIRQKMRYTGYLRREAPDLPVPKTNAPIEGPYLLVTSGGGGDGETLVDWVLRAYEKDSAAIGVPVLIILGPFMSAQLRTEFRARIDQLDSVQAITFDSHVELLMENCTGVVAMGGYNTFCEILSFDKPAIIVPRSVPRKEQLIRATKADDIGLVRCLESNLAGDTSVMVDALKALPTQHKPSTVKIDRLLDGADVIADLARLAIEERAQASTRASTQIDSLDGNKGSTIRSRSA